MTYENGRLYLSLLFVFSFALCSCHEEIEEIEEIEKNKISSIRTECSRYTIEEKEYLTINVIHTPEDLPAPEYAINIFNPEVLLEVVSKSELTVYGKSPGVSYVGIYAMNDHSVWTRCEVTVIEKKYPVTSIVLDKTSLTLKKGKSETLNVTINPDNATYKDVIWSSSDESVATVVDGVVTALSNGRTTITVTTIDGELSANCEVTVICPVESISLDKTSVELMKGEQVTLTATVFPEDATNQNLLWSSSAESIVSVVNGVLTAHKGGIGKIKVSNGHNIVAYCKVTVICPVESISLNKSYIELFKGEMVTLNATIYPEDATNKNVVWTSSNESVATVINGTVTALRSGQTTIIATTEDGAKTACCDITVTSIVEQISLDKSSVELLEGEELTLVATISPDDATNKGVTWTSSNESVATVVNGVVTAIKAGQTMVTVTTEDGEKTASCKVTVKLYTESVGTNPGIWK